MNKKFLAVKILSISVAVILLGYAGYYFAKDKPVTNETVVYGKLKQFAGSGSMKFYYYDVKSDKISELWFWAMPMIEDKIALDDFVKYVGDNKDSVFKIVGKKGKDDCGYIEGICLEDIIVSKIEVAK